MRQCPSSPQRVMHNLILESHPSIHRPSRNLYKQPSFTPDSSSSPLSHNHFTTTTTKPLFIFKHVRHRTPEHLRQGWLCSQGPLIFLSSPYGTVVLITRPYSPTLRRPCSSAVRSRSRVSPTPFPPLSSPRSVVRRIYVTSPLLMLSTEREEHHPEGH